MAEGVEHPKPLIAFISGDNVRVSDGPFAEAKEVVGGMFIIEADNPDEALRIASGTPRVFLDTDARTIPNEVATPDGDRLGEAVHLHKGCYRGQETVARVHTLGRPPRRLTLLHLDGSEERLPEVGTPVLLDGRDAGRLGTASFHHELGPIALALLKRGTPVDAELVVGGVAASQEVVVDPELPIVQAVTGRR